MKLTSEELKKLFSYVDGKLFWNVRPSKRIRVGDEAGSISIYGYRQVCISRKTYFTHRLIFMMFNGYLPKIVDHIDRDTSNNRIENLREVSAVQSSYNRGLQSNNTSGIKGVTWHRHYKKWQVQLHIDKKYKYFGSFVDKELAELVAIEASNKYHKEFSCYARQ